jgi:internalin A
MVAYKYNDNIDSLEIDPQYLNIGLEYAKENDIKSIRITAINQNSGCSYKLSFDIFSSYTDIKELRVADTFKFSKGSNVDGIYLLEKLEYFAFDDPIFKTDFSNLPNIKKLFCKYNKYLSNLQYLQKLEELQFVSFSEDNLTALSYIRNLQALYLVRGSFKSLTGVEKLSNLKRIDISYNSQLKDISSINSCQNLKILNIEKCKLLHDYSFLTSNKNIKELFIDSLDSISFINDMNELEKINFWENKDGNMMPLIKSKSLKHINFYPNKKHYSHTIEEIIKNTGAKRGLHK